MHIDSQKEFQTDQLFNYKGAKVQRPVECSYTILDAAIQKSMELLNHFDPDLEGGKLTEELKDFLEQNFGKYWHVVTG